MLLLDCTIRDGGYYNNWSFDEKLVFKYLELLREIDVDIIEIGYLNSIQRKSEGAFLTINNDMVITAKNILRGKEISLLVDYKKYSNSQILDLVESVPDLDMLRFAITPTDFLDCDVDFFNRITQTKKVAINIMYASKWKDDETVFSKMLTFDSQVLFYVVDSYGSLLPADVEIIANKLSKIQWAFHGHNNLELALANSLIAVSKGASIVDSTVRGMGRGAGNLSTELAISVLKEGELDISNLRAMGELNNLFADLYSEYNWGPSWSYNIAGLYSYPQGDVQTWLSKRMFSESDIASGIHQKSLYDDERIEILQHVPVGTTCVIIGGGVINDKEYKEIVRCLSRKEKIVIYFCGVRNVNLLSEYKIGSEKLVLAGQNGVSEKVLGLFSEVIVEKNSLTEALVLRERKDDLPLSNLTTQNSRDVNAIELLSENLESFKHVYAIGFTGYNSANARHIATMVAFENVRNKVIHLGYSGYVNINAISVTWFLKNYGCNI